MINHKHIMKVYQKPAVGTDYLTHFNAYNYRHTIAAVGGFDTASCDIAVRSREEGQRFLDQYIGNRVAFIVDNPVEPIWEGFINRMTFSAGDVQYTISLDEMANRVRAMYTTVNTSPAPTQGNVTTATVKSTYSQSLYGIKQEQIDLGYMAGGTGATIIRDTLLAQKALPKSSIIPGSGSGGLLHIEMLGFYHTLTWEDFRQTTSASVALGTLLDTIIGGILNGTTFFDNTDLTQTIANANAIDQQTVRGETVWDVLVKIQETGNTTVYFVIGVSPTNFQTGTRRFYYQIASSDIKYTARQSDGLRIRNLYGQLVPPWTVRPDAGVRVSDMLIGWNGIGDNPAETYIKKIDYDANQQTAIYSGDDDISAEGAFNYRRFNKSYGKRNGQARRI